MPKKPPAIATEALVEYRKREDAARLAGPRGIDRGDTTLAAFLDAYRAGYAPGHAAGTVRTLDRSIKSFVAFCHAARVVELRDVTADVCQRWMNDQANRGHGHGYIKLRRALLATAWAKAARKGTIPVNPWADAENPARKERKQRGSWTPDEFKRLVGAAAPWLRDVLTIGVNTGLRISALIGLRWPDIRWAGWADGGGLGEVVVRPENDKAGRGYTVPMSPACHDVLARRNLDTRDHDYVLTGMAGRPIRDGSHTRLAIVQACHRAGLPTPDSPNHHMRRSFGRWAVLGHLTGRPVPIYIVSKWMGHASVAMTERYLQLDTTDSHKWMMGGSPGGKDAEDGGQEPLDPIPDPRGR